MHLINLNVFMSSCFVLFCFVLFCFVLFWGFLSLNFLIHANTIFRIIYGKSAMCYSGVDPLW